MDGLLRVLAVLICWVLFHAVALVVSVLWFYISHAWIYKPKFVTGLLFESARNAGM